MKSLPWVLCVVSLLVPLVVLPKVDRYFDIAWEPGIERKVVTESTRADGGKVETHTTERVGRSATPLSPVLAACAVLLAAGLWLSRGQQERHARAARAAGVPALIAMALSSVFSSGSGGWPDIRPQVIAAIWVLMGLIAGVRARRMLRA